jgi:dihydrofolate synthase/folylpolyglutamate synthase
MPSTDYADTLAWLYALEAAKGMDFKLERVALALKNLGRPQRRYPCIHIGGTNGKGSVAAMIHAVYEAAGYRVGLYISPHLVGFAERIRVGSTLVSEDAVVELAREIRAAATSRGIGLTFFEFVTVMAFLHFARSKVDVAVIEVGLGGRLDATNVIEPLVSVITSIDLDHEDYLGNSVESVAMEKSGIIKPGVPVVVGRVPAAARAAIESAAAERNAPARFANDDFHLSRSDGVFYGIGPDLAGISLSLGGRFQTENAAVAITTLRLAADTLPLGDESIRRGLSSVAWPGRFEVVPADPLVVVDGAHNRAAARMLVDELPAVIGERKLHLLFAVMRDKRWEPMLDELIPGVASVTLTTALPGRGEDPQRLAEFIGSRCPVRMVQDAEAAFAELVERVPRRDAILVTGSLFLVGQVYPAFSRWRQRVDGHLSPG